MKPSIGRDGAKRDSIMDQYNSFLCLLTARVRAAILIATPCTRVIGAFTGWLKGSDVVAGLIGGNQWVKRINRLIWISDSLIANQPTRGVTGIVLPIEVKS